MPQYAAITYIEPTQADIPTPFHKVKRTAL